MLLQETPKIKSIRSVKHLRGKTVLVRCDFNVSFNGNKILDNYKIIKTLPTIRFLLAKGAKVILVSHLGRPVAIKGKNHKNKKVGSLKPVAVLLKKLLGKQVVFIEDFTKNDSQQKVHNCTDKQVVLLENIRFFKGEEENNKQFAKKLAQLADIYVNDAMAVSHRNHASVSAIKKYLPAYAGLLLETEVLNLHKVLQPKQPFVVIIGGSKINTKVKVIKRLKKKAQAVLIGGMISYDFLAAHNFSTGKYKPDKNNIKIAKKIMDKKVVLPVDLVGTSQKNGQGQAVVYNFNALPKNKFQLDIGPETIHLYAKYIKGAQTVLWNGPMGMFESSHFKTGTMSIARLVATHSRGTSFGLVGGGETVAALKKTNMFDNVDWVSTAGGAMLTYLAGGKMPGLKKIVK